MTLRKYFSPSKQRQALSEPFLLDYLKYNTVSSSCELFVIVIFYEYGKNKRKINQIRIQICKSVMKNILEVKNLSVSFDKNDIIKDLSFAVKEGEFLTVLGPNGSGKTVLLKTLLGLIPEHKGEVTWNKEAKLGYLPQGLTHLKVKDSPLSVIEFLSLKNKNRDEIKKHLTMVGIKDELFLKKRIGTLSGGQFQRMLMAWALFDEPNVLLFDEPTTGVDVHGEETVYNLLRDLQKKRKLTIILITHDVNIVYKYSTDVLCMSHDNICHSKPEEILSPERLEELYGMPVKLYKHNH